VNKSLKVKGHRFRSKCSISRTLELVGDKWTLLIVRDLMWHGKHTFQALQASSERIPTNILADRLRRLMDWGLVRREPYQDRPVRYAYHLTEAGRTLEPVLLQIMQWGHLRLDGGLFDPPGVTV
jgi:DNA-binding HxlR family transcriptional regulator